MPEHANPRTGFAGVGEVCPRPARARVSANTDSRRCARACLRVTVQGETAMLLASSLRRLCGHDSPVRQKRARTALEDGTRAGVFEVVEDASMLLA